MAVTAERRVGFDGDGVVVWREPAAFYPGFLKNLILRPSLPTKGLQDIPRMDHTPQDLPRRGWKDRISARFHYERIAIPGVAEIIRGEIESGNFVCIVTGRKATCNWYDQTEAQLKRENIHPTAIFMTPVGMSGLDSKADVIREEKITDFFEDDKRTILFLAGLFPDVRFNHIDHGLEPLTEEELRQNPNINVIPIDQLRVQQASETESAVRNSKLRDLTNFVDPFVEKFDEAFDVPAWVVTAAGVGCSIAGIELFEHQNRTNKYTRGIIALASSLTIAGWVLDLLDGKLARVRRAKMTDQKAKDRDELIGQALDPVADGIIEMWQAKASANTASQKGNEAGVKRALWRMRTTNGPRFAKAFVGCFGINVPETYTLKDLLHGDIRPLGVSLGRKGPNYLATAVHEVKGVPLQSKLDIVAPTANMVVTGDRLGALLGTKGIGALSKKEIKQAQFRAAVLGVEGLAFIGIAYLLKRVLLSKNKKG